jgi:hypothetical protein
MYEGKPALIHECKVGGYPYLAGRIKTLVYMGGGKMRYAKTEYSVTMDRRVMPWRPSEAFRDALYNLLWAVRTSGKGLLLDDMSFFFWV